MTFHCWIFPPLGIPDVGYSVQLPMTFHCWVFRRWAFHCWVFQSFCPEYPTTKIPNFSVGYSRFWVFRTVTMTFHCWVFRTVTDDIPLLGIPSLGIPVGYSGHFARNTQRPKYPTFLLGILVVGYSVQLPTSSTGLLDTANCNTLFRYYISTVDHKRIVYCHMTMVGATPLW